jgi:serine/threonine protein kinase
MNGPLTGSRLAHFEVLDKIGEGGMGLVYRARDVNLDRLVALKVLPPAAVADPERKRRFIQEARTASSLNHPNIVTIYEIAADRNIDFIAMELVPGKTLDQTIAGQPLPIKDTLKYAIQIAGALAAAHSAGIVHRDLKPGNVMVTPAGSIKVLDFGLAKLTERLNPSDSAPTLTVHTDPGAIVGTVAYMSPEQAEAKHIDARSDIFAFGAVFYEMLTARRAFQRESKAAMLSAILREDPAPIPQHPEEARIVDRCLRKDPSRRFQSATDLQAALEDLLDESAIKQTSVAHRPWIALALVPALAALSAYLWLKQPPAPAAELKVVPLTSYPGTESFPSLSPDGNQVAFFWSGEKPADAGVYVLAIGSNAPPLKIAGNDATQPVWSPDGRWIAFVRTRGDGKLDVSIVSPLGGPERKVTEIGPLPTYLLSRYIGWGEDSNTLIVSDVQPPSPAAGLFVVSLESGEKRRVTQADPSDIGDSAPVIAAGGHTLLFCRASSYNLAVWLSLPISQGLIPEGPAKPITPRKDFSGGAAFTLDGAEIILGSSRGSPGGLWRAPSRGGDAVRIPFVGEFGQYPSISGHAGGGAARLVYAKVYSDLNIHRLDLSSPALPPVQFAASTLAEMNPQYSPDGARVVFGSDRSGDLEIWVSDRDGGNPIQLTRLQASLTGSPRWSPDGQTIVFDSNLEGRTDVYLVSASGGQPRRLTHGPAICRVPSFSRDGRWIYFNSNRGNGDQIWKIPSKGGNGIQVTRNTGYVAFESTDGQWLFYTQFPRDASPIWKMPVSGGEPVKVLDGVFVRAFQPIDSGIYWIGFEKDSLFLHFYDFAGKKSTTIAPVGSRLYVGLAISPDRRYALFARTDTSIADLMLVDNFR